MKIERFHWSILGSGHPIDATLFPDLHTLAMDTVQSSETIQADLNARDKAEEQRQNEIRASIRSLKTNLLITFVIMVCSAITDPMPHYMRAYVISFIKAMSPVITMAANFGKVKEYLNDIKENFRLEFCRTVE